MSERYYVDERTGCIAVRDRTLDDPEQNGLHENVPGVVAYWNKPLKTVTCPHCHHEKTVWDNDTGLKELVEAFAKELNQEDSK